MSSTDPRVNPAPSVTTESGNGATAPAGTSVAVATGVEVALAAVQQQLLRQAEAVRVETVQVVTPPVAAPVVATPAPVVRAAPPPDVIATAPVRVREVAPTALLVDDDVEAEFWGEPRRRPTERRIDPDELTSDERKSLGRLKARKVRRIVRSVSPWSVFKFSVFFYLCLWLIMMVAGVILWKLAVTSGVITNIEKFYAKAAGEKSFELDGRSLFRAGASAGAILVLAATAFTVLMSVLFNLITDLTGGVKMTVLELESARRDLRRRRPAAADVKAKAAIDGSADAESVDGDDATELEVSKGAVAETRKRTASTPPPKVPSLTPKPVATDTSTDTASRNETPDLDWSKSTTTSSTPAKS